MESQRSAVLQTARNPGCAWLLLCCLSACGSDGDTSASDGAAVPAQGFTGAPSSPLRPSAPASVAGSGAAGSGTSSAPMQNTGALQPTAAGAGALVPGMPMTAAAAGAAAPAGHDHGGAAAMTPTMTQAMSQCKLHTEPDVRDAKLTDEPLKMTVGLSQDTLMPQIVLDWMDENQFAEAHDGWHLVRKWDQTCRKSNATTCSASQRLTSQGLARAPVQQGAPGDGLAFMMMHRHMIHMLNTAFPTHPKLFSGFATVPKKTSDADNPQPWRDIGWSSDNLTGFDTLEHIEQHLDKFPTDDDLGQYIENTYRWTATTPMSPVSLPGSGLHGALHSQWSVSGSPANLIQQSVDVKNYAFWKLHGWIDNVWDRYRKAKGLKEDEPAYMKLMEEQCMEMFMLQPKNRTGMQPTTGGTTSPTGSTAPETGMFAQQVRPFLDSTCGGCHSPIAPTAGVTLGGMGISSAEIIEGLVGMKASNGEFALVEPGSPEKSWLYLKASGDVKSVTCTSACDRESMPPSGMGLSAPQIASLKQWIMAGATKQ